MNYTQEQVPFMFEDKDKAIKFKEQHEEKVLAKHNHIIGLIVEECHPDVFVIRCYGEFHGMKMYLTEDHLN